MTFNEFVTKYLGKMIDFDGAYAGQCVDLFRQYIKEVHNFPQPKGVVGAADFWTNYDTDPNLKNYYEKIPNSPTGVPQNGDVMIWNKNAGGGFGHISVFISGDVNSFVSFDQNWPTLSKCTKTTHDYNNVLGWLRPKKIENNSCLINNDDEGKKLFESLVSKASKYDTFVTMGYSDPETLKNTLKAKDETINSLSSDLSKERTAKETAEALNVTLRQSVDTLNGQYLTAQATVDIVTKVGKEQYGMTDDSFKTEEAYSEALKTLSEAGNISELTTSEIVGELWRRITSSLDQFRK